MFHYKSPLSHLQAKKHLRNPSAGVFIIVGSAVLVEDLENVHEGVVLLVRLLVGQGLQAGTLTRRRRSRTGRRRPLPRLGKGVGVHAGAHVFFKAGGDDGHADLVLQLVVEGGAEDDERVGMGGLLDQVGRRLHFLQTDVHGAGDIDQHALGAIDGGLQQGAGDGHLGGLLGLVLAGSPAHTHVGHPRILHDGGDVGKVQVDEAGVLDEVGDGLDRLTQHIVGDLKGIGKGDLLVGGKLQPLVGDDDQGVHPGAQVLDAPLGLLHTAAALEVEGLGHHAHGEDAQLLGDVGHDGGRAGAGAAAHTGGDEDHVGLLQHLGDLVAALLGGLAAHLGVAARALALGELLTDLYLVGRGGIFQRLLVRIHGDKVHALHAGAHHAVDYIAAAAAHADHLDRNDGIRPGVQSKSHACSSYVNMSKNTVKSTDCAGNTGSSSISCYIVSLFSPQVKSYPDISKTFVCLGPQLFRVEVPPLSNIAGQVQGAPLVVLDALHGPLQSLQLGFHLLVYQRQLDGNAPVVEEGEPGGGGQVDGAHPAQHGPVLHGGQKPGEAGQLGLLLLRHGQLGTRRGQQGGDAGDLGQIRPDGGGAHLLQQLAPGVDDPPALPALDQSGGSAFGD